MSKKSHEPQAPYLFERLEGRADEPDDNPLDLSNYNNFEYDEIERLRGQIRLYRKAIEDLTLPQAGQDEIPSLVSDFSPVCKHHFDYFPARYHWLDFRCVYCGYTLEPDDLCKMLDAGALTRILDTAPIDAAIRARFAEGEA